MRCVPDTDVTLDHGAALPPSSSMACEQQRGGGCPVGASLVIAGGCSTLADVAPGGIRCSV